MSVAAWLMRIGLQCNIDWKLPPPWMAHAILLEIAELEQYKAIAWAEWGIFAGLHTSLDEPWKRFTILREFLINKITVLHTELGKLRSMMELKTFIK